MNILAKRLFGFAVIAVFILLFCGCAAKKKSMPKISNIASVPGIYHKVANNETLWNISKDYNIRLDDLVAANKIPDASKINSGQLIFIPNAAKDTYTEINKSFSTSDSGFIWPVKGRVLTHFGIRYNGIKSKGIKIKAKEGVKIVAARSGEISFCEDKVKGKGRTIIIDHHDGFITVYAHNSENLVTAGQAVRQGETIAKVGSTGRSETPQLYFEIRKGHKPQNPFYYLP